MLPCNLLRGTGLAALLETTGVRALDLGSRGGLDPILLPAAWVTDAIGFEPDPVSFQELVSQEAGPWRSVKWLPHAVGAEVGGATLYVPRAPEGSSLLEHNALMIEEFGHADLFTVSRTEIVRTVTLDSLRQADEIQDCDYLKLDIEGAELSVLTASPETLAATLAVRIEAAFVEQRVRQPLVADAMAFMTERGFLLADIFDIHRWRGRVAAADPYVVRSDLPYSRGRPAQCDMLFVRRGNPDAPAEWNVRLAVISMVLGFFDHAKTVFGLCPAAWDLADERCRCRLAAALSDGSRTFGRARAAAEMRQSVRKLIPLFRSRFGGLPS